MTDTGTSDAPEQDAGELKACPFCGANEEGFRRAETGCPKVEDLSEGGWRVTCYTCRYSICWEPFPTREAAITAWNSRPATPIADTAIDEGVKPEDAFELGFAWAMGLRGQTLEDSRAVGRTLLSDLFEPIAERMDLSEFDSFQSADKGICAAKKIIIDALTRPTPTAPTAGEVELREWALDKSSTHHRIAHENPHLRTEHVASSAAYRELAAEIDKRRRP